MIQIGESSTFSELIDSVAPVFIYDPSHVVRIGSPLSFRGSISDFRIYSPGSSAVITKSKTFSLKKILI